MTAIESEIPVQKCQSGSEHTHPPVNSERSRDSTVLSVLGHETEAVRSAVDDLPVSFVENEARATGQASSVRCGLGAVGPSVGGVRFALGDMPDVQPSSIEALVDAFAAGVGDPVVAAFEGQQGNPVVFGRQHFERPAAGSGDIGGRTILDRLLAKRWLRPETQVFAGISILQPVCKLRLNAGQLSALTTCSNSSTFRLIDLTIAGLL